MLLMALARHVLSKDKHDERCSEKLLEHALSSLVGPSKVFVYGTLRIPKAKTFTLKGYRLESAAPANHNYPIIVPDPNGTVVGNVVEYMPHEMLQADRYENAGNLYGRTLVSVSDGTEDTTAWVYIPIGDFLTSPDNIVIANGDWMAFTPPDHKKK